MTNHEHHADSDKNRRMRASDAERQTVVELLKDALDHGRLKMDEYVERMEKAYEAVTVGDLEVLHDDLPKPTAPVAASTMPPFAAAPPAPPAPMPPMPPMPHVRPQVFYGVPAPAPPPPPSPPGIRGFYSDMPAGLKVLWTIWSAVVSINVVVWVLVGATSASIPYPWPLWVAGPAGAALFGVTAPVVQARRSRWEKQRRQLPPAS